MAETEPLHPAVRFAGWLALLLGLAIPLGASVVAMGLSRTSSCENVQWSFAPLVAACRPVGGSLTAYGWFGTTSVLALVAIAVAVATAGALRIPALRGAARADAIQFAITVLAVLAIVVATLIRQLDPTLPINGWVFFASAAGMVVTVASIIVLALRLEAGGRI